MKVSIQVSALVFVLLAGSVFAEHGEWATVRLKVVYDGPAPVVKPAMRRALCAGLPIPDERMLVGKDGELANLALVMDMKKSEATEIHPSLKKPSEKPLEIIAKNCRFVPRVAFVQAGQSVIVRNADACGHNFKLDPFSNRSFNMLIPIDGKSDFAFENGERSNFTEFTCTIHPWMRGQLVIRDHPYVAISDTKGLLEIKDLPTGKVTFKFAHENMKKSIDAGTLDGEKAQWPRGYITLDLKPGLNDIGVVKLSPALFEE